MYSHNNLLIMLKIEYNPENINNNAKKSVGLDPGFGSSNFVFVVTQLVDGKMKVIHAEEYDGPDFSDMINEVGLLKRNAACHQYLCPCC
jgi:hypothetical protein